MRPAEANVSTTSLVSRSGRLLFDCVYVETLKLSRSRVLLLILLLIFLLSVVLLAEFQSRIAERYHFFARAQPEVVFAEYFLTKLSNRVHWIVYLCTVCITMLSLELDMENEFIPRQIRTTPVTPWLFLGGKAIVCSALSIALSAVVFFYVPVFVNNYFASSGIALQNSIGAIATSHWVAFSVTVPAIVCFLIAFTIFLRRSLLLNLVLFLLLFAIAGRVTFLYPFSFVRALQLTTHTCLTLSGMLACAGAVLLFLSAGIFALRQKRTK